MVEGIFQKSTYIECKYYLSIYIPHIISLAKRITSGFLMDRLVALSKQRTILPQPLLQNKGKDLKSTRLDFPFFKDRA